MTETNDFSIKVSGGQVQWKHLSNPSYNTLKSTLEDGGFRGFSWTPADRPKARAKFADYQDFYYLRVYALELTSDAVRMVQPVSLHAVANDQALITWSETTLGATYLIRDKVLATNTKNRLSNAHQILSWILDALLGEMFAFLDHVNERIAEVERAVIRRRRRFPVQERIMALRREIFRIRQTLASMRDAIYQWVRYWARTESGGDPGYYLEIYDQVIRLFDTVDTLRELVNSTLDVYLASVSNHLNEIVKTLTLVATLLLPASLVATIYGMNFKYLPGADSPYGFYVVLLILGVSSASLLWLFRRRGWL